MTTRLLFLVLPFLLPPTLGAVACNVRSVQYKGWAAIELSNAQDTVTLVPQLGGRVMQVAFLGHDYLFVNPEHEGRYISPVEAKGKWINYGGDKLWPMPEGSEDEGHWVLSSDELDDGVYTAKTLEAGKRCTVELTGPADPVTGLGYTRTVSIDDRSPAIRFRATMRNTTAHTIRWSMQSVSQYSLASAKKPGLPNGDLWAYTAVNPKSAYLGGYYVRSGLADDPSFQASNGMFRLHWLYLANEVWIDSTEGWLAVADGESGFGMLERFNYDSAGEYPGKATVIFYKNGPSVAFSDAGQPALTPSDSKETPYYMEAEINSPTVSMKPDATYSMETTWFPLRTASHLEKVTEAGLVTARLRAFATANTLRIDGAFGVTMAGQLEARLYDAGGAERKRASLDPVAPSKPYVLAALCLPISG